MLRPKTVVPLIALLTIGFFFWAVERYDRAAFLRFKHPVDRVTSSSPTQIQLPEAQASAAPKKTCDIEPGTTAPLPMSEWLPRKNYTRAYFRPRHVGPKTEFHSLEDIAAPVLPPFKAMERGMVISPDNEDPTLPCPNIIDVDVAADHDADETSKMLFGLATTADRLDRLLPTLLYSYGGTKASLIVLVPESDDDLDKQETYFRNRGLDVTLIASPLDFTARYFGMVEAFANHIRNKRPQTTWVGFMDDDTFFLSLPTIAQELKLFDVNKKHYIGSLSEASWQVDAFGNIAFGGAGVFVSKPLLDVLETYYDECQSWGEQPGDQKLGQCIQRFGETPLTLWPSLFQMDMKGDVDGVYESGRKIESMHHWNSWYNKDVVKMTTVAAAAGRRSVLRRWVFDQEEHVNALTGKSTRTFWVLTNGISLIKYTYDENTPDDAINFDHTEKTWEEDARGYESRLGPLRPVEQEGILKDRWVLREAFVVGDNVHQWYVREEDEGHSVIEIVWLGPKGGGGAGVGGYAVKA
ncbi:hypothetical protein ASPWEDRAFT_168086 [Aspergillus wentii DTO 134E9]|uniref:Glycosyltransferase family 31 protein n=1 Tax=Aspergillus wentii DTO 134E9 TaxID=1073089 RepID=A0A1L9RTC3_ASPWE|nr:uncharacterized protein ASPWEDRAFT_168086 [Aspergillus wentii DTO 134E9]KAI9933811.1 hypothetical protein MW887_004883 [Aspergillus wentii]OJJ38154.1 hypothetical protein ASPWEDRAFT_168086 [Aspergillus wentii DTO 134E9]